MGNLSWPKFLKFWFPVILYSGIIFCVSSMPNVKTPLEEMQFDKILHVLAYLPFGFLLAMGLCNTRVLISRGVLLGLVLLFSFLYGVSDEIHQAFVPGRYAGMGDVIADTVGGVLGGYIYPLFLDQVEKNN